MSPLPDPNDEYLLMTTNKKETATGRSLFCRVFDSGVGQLPAFDCATLENF